MTVGTLAALLDTPVLADAAPLLAEAPALVETAEERLEPDWTEEEAVLPLLIEEETETADEAATTDTSSSPQPAPKTRTAPMAKPTKKRTTCFIL